MARVGPQSRQEKKQGTIQEPQTLFCWSSRLASLTPEPAQGGHLGPLNKGTSREHRPSFPTSLKESSICLSSQEKPDFKWGASCPNSVGGGVETTQTTACQLLILTALLQIPLPYLLGKYTFSRYTKLFKSSLVKLLPL